jgi:transposase
MKPLHLPSESEIREAAREGENAAVALVFQAFGKLMGRFQKLEVQIAKNSSNSSKPPSSEGFNKPTPKSLRKHHGKKSGGQPGHEGSTLKAVAHSEYITVHRVKQCYHCQSSLEDATAGSARRWCGLRHKTNFYLKYKEIVQI